MSNVRRIQLRDDAATFREMARARHVEAVLRLEAGDSETWFSMLRDVAALNEQARREQIDADRRRGRLAMQLEERRRMAAALTGLLELADRHAPRDAG